MHLDNKRQQVCTYHEEFHRSSEIDCEDDASTFMLITDSANQVQI